ncbi:MAG: hypothetical protein ACR2JQ_12540, partial [Mycobacteriales bacterium]
ALTFLGGVDLPHSLGTTLELPAPWTQLRRRSWPIHPGCECTDPATDTAPGFDGDATNQAAGPPLPRAGSSPRQRAMSMPPTHLIDVPVTMNA